MVSQRNRWFVTRSFFQIALLFSLFIVGTVLLWLYAFSFDEKQSRFRLQNTVRLLETTHQANMAQGQDAEWFNLYAYLLYHGHYNTIGVYSVRDEYGYAASHPCACETIADGWIELPDGVVISGLTAFWTHPQPALMVPLCIDTNGKHGPNQSGKDVFLGRLFNRAPNQKASFDWKHTDYACPNIPYVSVDTAL